MRFLVSKHAFLVLASAFFVSAGTFGQSITATKAYVDRKYSEATNAIPAIVTNEVATGWSDWVFEAKDPDVAAAFKANPPRVVYVASSVMYDPHWYGDFPELGIAGIEKSQEDGQMDFHSGSDAEVLTFMPYDDMRESGNFHPEVVYAKRKKIIQNALGLAMLKDVPNYETVTNVARSVVNSVWDASLGVAWEARMHNGHLYYIAVTNRPPEGK